MRRLRQSILWLLALLVALATILLVAANLYVQSQGTQNRLQQEISQRLGMPLHVQRVSVTPWGGLTLSGIALNSHAANTLPTFLTAKSFRLRANLRSIFRPPLIVKDIALIEPVVVWPQDESGKWRLPGSHARGGPAGTSPEPTPRLKPEAAPDFRTPLTPGPGASTARSSLPAQHMRLIDGRFDFVDYNLRPLARFEGVQLSSAVREENTLRGKAEVGKINLQERLHFSNLQTPLVFEKGSLFLNRISAHLARGDVLGDFVMQTQAADSPYTAHAELSRVQANDLVVEAGGPADVLSGILDGAIEVSGNTTDFHALSGSGHLQLSAGRVQQFAILAVLGELLQIEELTQLNLQDAETKFHFANGEVALDSMSLRSPNLRLNATGTVSFEGKLALNAALAINDKIRGQLPRAVRENFAATSEAGFYSLDFHVTGSVSKPRTDLMERVIGHDLRDLGSVVDALLGRSKKKKKEPSSSETATPAEVSPTPAPTP